MHDDGARAQTRDSSKITKNRKKEKIGSERKHINRTKAVGKYVDILFVKWGMACGSRRGHQQIRAKTSLPTPFPLLLSTSIPIKWVFPLSQSTRRTPPSQPPITEQRFSYARVTFRCALLPLPRASHSSGVTRASRVVWIA